MSYRGLFFQKNKTEIKKSQYLQGFYIGNLFFIYKKPLQLLFKKGRSY